MTSPVLKKVGGRLVWAPPVFLPDPDGTGEITDEQNAELNRELGISEPEVKVEGSVARFEWDESLHPRGEGGRWGEGEGHAKKADQQGQAQVNPESQRVSAEKASELWDRALETTFADLSRQLAPMEHLFEKEEIKDRIAEQLMADARSGPLVIHAPERAIDGILEKGSFLTQHDTKTSGGTYYPELRTERETEMFGEGVKPIYGVVDRNTERVVGSAGEQYGQAQFVLNDDLRERATVTFGDSLGARDATPVRLDETATATILAATTREVEYRTLIVDAVYSVVSERGMNLQDRERFFDHMKTDPVYRGPYYIETQIQGAVSLDDVKEVRFSTRQKDRSVVRQIRSKLEGRIPVDGNATPHETFASGVRDRVWTNGVSWLVVEAGGEKGAIVDAGGTVIHSALVDDVLKFGWWYPTAVVGSVAGNEPNGAASVKVEGSIARFEWDESLHPRGEGGRWGEGGGSHTPTSTGAASWTSPFTGNTYKPGEHTVAPASVVTMLNPKAEQQFGPILAAMGALHGVPSTPVEVKMGRTAKTLGGKYQPQGNVGPKPAMKDYPDEKGRFDRLSYEKALREYRQKLDAASPAISVNAGDKAGVSFLHEMGHHMDLRGTLTSRFDSASSRANYEDRDNPEAQPDPESAFLAACRGTDAYRELRREPGASYTTSPLELWARAYSQWGAAVMQDESMKEGLDRLRDTTDHVAGYQWSDDEFKQVAPYVEGVLESWNLMEKA